MLKVMRAFKVYKGYATEGDLGVEIEVEGHNLPDAKHYWKRDYDGSLRGECTEYVLRKAMTLPEVKKALISLNKAYKDNKTKVNDSVRAGVHIHVNVQHLTVVQLFNFMTTYIILEDLLVRYCGEYREGNLFCLRIKDADYLLYTLEKVARDKTFHKLNNDVLRYSSMNVVSLAKYGSLEFRAMRGSRDLKLIGRWAEILLKLRNRAITFSNPKEIVELVNEHGSESFLKAFLGDFFDEICNGINPEEYIPNGLLRASGLANSADWDSYESKLIGGLDFPLGVEFPDEPQEDY